MNLSRKIVNLCRKVKDKVFSNGARIYRMLREPSPPVNEDGKVLIHLGCGQFNDSRWINIDLLYLPHIHHIQDVTVLDNFPDNVADLIYACHTFEHIKRPSLVPVLKEWRRVLRDDGVLRIAVPNFDYLVDEYIRSGRMISSIVKPLMGGQNYKYNFHYSVFNRDYLTELLKEAGFREVRVWDPKTAKYHNFNDTSFFPLSLNLEAVK